MLRLVEDDRPRAMNGSSIYQSKEVSTEELERAEADLRKQAKELYAQIETTYWDLGRCLYEVYDGVPGGYRDLIRGKGAAAARNSLFAKWGFENFGDYCEREIGIKKRSGEALRYAYYWFEIHLNIPLELKKEMRTLGRSKVYLLSGFATKEDVMEWVAKAKSFNYEDLKKAVNDAKGLKPAKKDEDNEGDQDPGAPPPPETLHNVQAGLYDEQWKTYNAAIDRAKNLSKSEKIGHNLELICQDFLANNGFTKPEEDANEYLAKMERQLNLKLIALDPLTGVPIFGADLLWMLVKSKAESNRVNAEEVDEVDESDGNDKE